jgi:hypothetical protein
MTEQEILNLNDPHQSFWYCYYINKDANINAHQDIIINSNSIHYCYLFAKDIKSSNKELLFEKLLKYKDLDYIKAFYDNVNFNKSKYETLLLFI